MNKSTYLPMPVLDISKTLMYELWYDYIKTKVSTELCSRSNKTMLHGY